MLKKNYKYWDNEKKPEFFKNVKTKLTELDDYLQCWMVDIKKLTYGFRFTLFVLSSSELNTNNKKNITEQTWDDLSSYLQKQLIDYLGDTAEIYKEPFSTTRKFQLRYETYVQELDDCWTNSAKGCSR